MTALSELLHTSKFKAPAAIKRIADSDDHKMDRGTVYKYWNGIHPERPQEKYLEALAHGFGLSIKKVREAALVPPGELGPWKPPLESGQLSKPVRAALDHLIVTLVKEGYGHGKRPAEKSWGHAGEPVGQEGDTPVYEAEPSGVDEDIDLTQPSKEEGATGS